MRPPVHICALLGNPTFPTSKLENSKSRFPGCYSVSCSLVKQRSFRKGQGSEGDTRSTGSDGKRLLPVTAGHWSLPSCRSRFSPSLACSYRRPKRPLSCASIDRTGREARWRWFRSSSEGHPQAGGFFTGPQHSFPPPEVRFKGISGPRDMWLKDRSKLEM